MMISNAQLAKVESAIQQKDQQNKSLRAKLAEKLQVDKSVALLETIGAAAASGALRGKFEDPNGAWNIPNTSVDIEMVAGIALIALGYYAGTKYGASLRKMESHLMNAGYGVLAHYCGQIARNSVKQGSFTMVAGNSALSGY